MPREARNRCRAAILLAALIAVLPGPPLRAGEPCNDGAGIDVLGAPALAFHDSYSPFDPLDLTETISIIVANRSPAACDLSIIFTTDDGSGRLGNGGKTLIYNLETASGAPLLRPASTMDPQAGAHIPLTLAQGQSAAITLRGRVPALQVAAAGTYADASARIRVYRSPENGDFGALLTQSSFPVSAQAAAVCTMSAPEPASVDFSDDIGADARPAGALRTVQLPEAACNTAARLKLSGAPLAHEADAALRGFDSFINFEAQANFGSVSTTLATAQAGQTDEAASAPTPGAASAPVELTLRLLAGRALAAGEYSGVLTITLEPWP